MLWSPFERKKYAVVNAKGILTGLGANPVFNGRPGLWNLVWLHSVQVDMLLGLPFGSPDQDILNWTNIIGLCDKSADCKIGGMRFETLAELLPIAKFIDKVKQSDADIPIRNFLDAPENDSWLDFVLDRINL